MPKKQNPPKWHHYVPVGYLKNFAAGNDFFGFNKIKQKAFPTKPVDVAAEDYFHTDNSRADPTELETRLARQFETPLLRDINCVIRRVRLAKAGLPTNSLVTPAEHLSLAKFAALQYIRTKAVREQMLAEAHKEITAGVTLTAGELAEKAHQNFIEQHLNDDLERFGQTIARHRLVFTTTTALYPYWTSDHPIIPARGKLGPKVDVGGVGLSDPNLELYLPLAWDIMAVFVGQHLQLPYSHLIPDPPEHVAEVNGMLLSQAHKFVFCRRNFSEDLMFQ